VGCDCQGLQGEDVSTPLLESEPGLVPGFFFSSRLNDAKWNKVAAASASNLKALQ
jgi:hypothetical protein